MSAVADTKLTASEWAAMLRNPLLDHRYQLTRLGPAVTDYLAWKRLSRAAEATLDQYERDLARMCTALADRDLKDVTTGDLILVINLFPPGSWKRARAALNGFFRWATRSEQIARNPCDLLPDMRPEPAPVYEIFTAHEQGALLNATRGSLLPLADRVRLGVLSHGARKSGARGLKVRDVNLADRFLLLTEKGRKTRLVPIRGAFVQHMDEYLMTPLPLLDRVPGPDDYLFFPNGATGSHGTRQLQLLWLDPTRPLSKTGYQRWWTTLADRAGVAYRNAHMMRHTYATDALDATGDLHGVKELLGHASTRTTEVYIHSSRRRLETVADRIAEYRDEETRRTGPVA